METVKDRIIQFIGTQGISNRKFCIEISVSHTYFSVKGAVSSDILVKILTMYPNINADWLVTGRGKMLLNNEPEKVENVLNEEREIYGIDYKQKYFSCIERSNELLEENYRLTQKLQPIKP